MIRRRTLVGHAAACVVLAPLTANAQRTEKLPRVALVFNHAPLADLAGADPADRQARAFVHALRDLGLVDSRNIIIERRSSQGRPDRLPSLMQELLALQVDAIVVAGVGAVAAQRATQTIPIVAYVAEAAGDGLGADLHRPDRNITGVAGAADPATLAKRLQLLKEVAPQATRVAFVDYVNRPGERALRPETEAAARALGFTPQSVGVGRPGEFEQAFAAMARDRADALVVNGTPVTYVHQRLIIEYAARHRLPAVYALRDAVASGGLMAYGANLADAYRRLAAGIDKILKGAKPADLPVERATRFETVINLKTAKALGLTIPQSLLLRADEVIQ